MSYNPQDDGIVVAKPQGALGFNLDARSTYYDEINFVRRPFISTVEVLSYFDTSFKREGQFIILINSTGILQSGGTILGGIVEEWWWRDGQEDYDLIKKITNVNDIPLPTPSNETFIIL